MQVGGIHIAIGKDGAQFLPLREIANMNGGGWLELPPVADLKTAFEQAGVGDCSRIILYGDYKGLFAGRTEPVRAADPAE